MASLREIKISASPDLSTNASLYDLEKQVMGERGLTDVLTFDKDFSAAGFTVTTS